jgi:hypothetical protein
MIVSSQIRKKVREITVFLSKSKKSELPIYKSAFIKLSSLESNRKINKNRRKDGNMGKSEEALRAGKDGNEAGMGPGGKGRDGKIFAVPAHIFDSVT